MKVLFLNTSDISGGAARACYRIFKGVQKIEGPDAKLLVKNKISDDFSVMIEKGKIGKIMGQVKSILDTLPTKLLKTENNILHSSAIFSLLDTKKINNFNPDIVHLHWICGGFVSVADLKKIRKPIIWTLHDMWAFCGAEHYTGECKRYIDGYLPNNRPTGENGFDINRWTWNRKKKAWKNLKNIIIVTPSKWLAECARKSVLFKNYRIEVIPNGIETDIFRPIEKEKAKEKLGLPKNKKFILFGAMSATTDPRKGFEYLKEALSLANFNEKDQVEIIVFGSAGSDDENKLGYPVHYMGSINDDALLATIYSAADVMVTPSLEDNLPNIVMESLSCGTPCVGFEVGGIPDMIEHKKNGYLAEYRNSKDLATGIEWILDNENYAELCQNARKKVVENFDVKIIAEKYKKLYDEILESKSNA